MATIPVDVPPRPQIRPLAQWIQDFSTMTDDLQRLVAYVRLLSDSPTFRGRRQDQGDCEAEIEWATDQLAQFQETLAKSQILQEQTERELKEQAQTVNVLDAMMAQSVAEHSISVVAFRGSHTRTR